MAIVRKLVAQDDNDDNQWIKVDHSSRYIVNDMDEWQFLFGPDSVLSKSTQLLKIAVELDKNDLNSLRFTAYLYNAVSGSIDNAATCLFNVYRIFGTGNWTEQLIDSFSGNLQEVNHYFFADKPLTDFSPIDFDGGDTLMIEAVVYRFGVRYVNRIYVNHLGIYDSLLRLKQEVQFLDLTKLDE